MLGVLGQWEVVRVVEARASRLLVERGGKARDAIVCTRDDQHMVDYWVVSHVVVQVSRLPGSFAHPLRFWATLIHDGYEALSSVLGAGGGGGGVGG
eukprot:COSAG04_NODE_267_length_18528_cov_60.607141_24_plen_96_part_00